MAGHELFCRNFAGTMGKLTQNSQELVSHGELLLKAYGEKVETVEQLTTRLAEANDRVKLLEQENAVLQNLRKTDLSRIHEDQVEIAALKATIEGQKQTIDHAQLLRRLEWAMESLDAQKRDLHTMGRERAVLDVELRELRKSVELRESKKSKLAAEADPAGQKS
jgi:hypothetical protein